jgi:hypothetical protein
MFGEMVAQPVSPVKAPLSNFPASTSNPCGCHTSGKSFDFPAPSDAVATPSRSAHSCLNSFAVISFADPHPLNSVISYRYKNVGGRGPSCFSNSATTTPCFRSLLVCPNSFALNLFADPHPLNLCATIFYKKGGGRGGASLSDFNLFQLSKLAGGFLLAEGCCPGRLPCYTGTGNVSPEP